MHCSAGGGVHWWAGVPGLAFISLRLRWVCVPSCAACGALCPGGGLACCTQCTPRHASPNTSPRLRLPTSSACGLTSRPSSLLCHIQLASICKLKLQCAKQRIMTEVCRYTTMVGKKTSLKVLRKELHARHVTAIRTTELAQVRVCVCLCVY